MKMAFTVYSHMFRMRHAQAVYNVVHLFTGGKYSFDLYNNQTAYNVDSRVNSPSLIIHPVVSLGQINDQWYVVYFCQHCEQALKQYVNTSNQFTATEHYI